MRNLLLLTTVIITFISCSDKDSEKDEIIYAKLNVIPKNIIFFEDPLLDTLHIYGGKEPFRIECNFAIFGPVEGQYVDAEDGMEMVKIDGRTISVIRIYGTDISFLYSYTVYDSSGQTDGFAIMDALWTRGDGWSFQSRIPN